MTSKNRKKKKQERKRQVNISTPIQPMAEPVITATDGANGGPKNNRAKKPLRLRPAWLMVVLTAIGILIYYLQYRTGERALISNRAFLTTTEARINKTVPNPNDPKLRTIQSSQALAGKLIAGDMPQLIITVVNTGNTPAQEAEDRQTVDIRKDFPSDGESLTYLNDLNKRNYIDPLGTGPSRSVIGKDGKIFIPGQPRHPLTQREVDEINSGRTFLVFYGFIAYKDGFENRRMTTFCDYFSPNTFGLVACPSHNHVD